jgi:hypothetical protein
MSRFGFCDQTYTVESFNADCQRSINWYVEQGGPNSKSVQQLYPTPGLKLFSARAGAQVRGEWTINSRSFKVVDATLYEQFADGSDAAIGVMVDDGNPSYMVASPQQLLIASGGFLYVYYLKTIGTVPAGTFVAIPAPTFPGPVDIVGYSDGFFVALVESSQQYFVSQSLDATIWPGLATQIISTFADNVVSMIVDHRQIWLLGAKQSEVDADAGSIPNPFQTVPGGFMEQGCAAEFATVQLDNGIFWIGQRNDQGGRVAWRSNGYSPTRVSNYAVENAWESYSTVADARAFSYVDHGHSFWVINFPTAQATWCYDAATQMWHERGFWFAQAGIYQAALPQCHTYNFGKHLVGDRQSGNVYQMSVPVMNGSAWDFVTDNGAAIRRLRRAPIISTENKWIYYSELTIDVETGLGPQPPLLDGAGNPREPILSLRYSNDSAHTWSNSRDLGLGMAGQYHRRCVARRLGRARQGRVFEVSCTDPVPVRLIDAYLDATPGFQTQERLTKQLTKVA